MEAPEESALAPGLVSEGWLEVEDPARDSDLPFFVLGSWPGGERAAGRGGPTAAPSLGRGAGDVGAWWRALRAAAARALRAAVPGARRAQSRGLAALNLLTCGLIPYFHEHLSPRNVALLAVSALVFGTAWLSLDPGPAGWALGLVYLLTASSRLGALEPLWTAAAAAAAQGAFDALPAAGRRALWCALGVLAVASELAWWPSVEFLVEADFHTWLVHFSTYYIVVIDFWFWPQLLQMDPTRWHITQEIQRAPAETREAIVDVGAGLAILVLLPLLACSLVAGVLIWRRSPRVCVAMGAAYLGLVGFLLADSSISPDQVASVGQVPIAAVFLVLAREQFASVFGDTRTWKGLAALLLCLLALRRLAVLGLLPYSGSGREEAAAIVLFQLFCKHWLAAQCSAIRQGLPSCLSRSAWLPRRTALLFGRDEAFDPRLTLGR